ncbi:hypothetical protein [Actinoplanes sp. NPDC051851]|uniref:hypothetical protein n=1 Tax=Actinoplanes sp. NPDC051851 TaxID=3154753 RepID=UPI00343D0492
MTLAAGEESTVGVALDLTPALERDPRTRTWSPRPGEWRFAAAPHSPATDPAAAGVQGVHTGRSAG